MHVLYLGIYRDVVNPFLIDPSIDTITAVDEQPASTAAIWTRRFGMTAAEYATLLHDNCESSLISLGFERVHDAGPTSNPWIWKEAAKQANDSGRARSLTYFHSTRYFSKPGDSDFNPPISLPNKPIDAIYYCGAPQPPVEWIRQKIFDGRKFTAYVTNSTVVEKEWTEWAADVKEWIIVYYRAESPIMEPFNFVEMMEEDGKDVAMGIAGRTSSAIEAEEIWDEYADLYCEDDEEEEDDDEEEANDEDEEDSESSE